jgi:hypothetical protein
MKMKRFNAIMQALAASIKTSRHPIICATLEVVTTKYLALMEKKILHEGKKHACSHFKHLHICAIRLVTKDTLPSKPFTKTDRRGVPLELNLVKPFLLSGDPDLIRMGLTITRFYELIVIPVEWDPSPITEKGPPLESKLIEEFTLFCEFWVKRLGVNNSALPIPKQLLGNLVQGPNGPSIATAHQDARAVMNDPSLCQSIKDLSEACGSSWIYDAMIYNGSHTTDNNFCHSRISLLQEGGGKTRVIAIGDYWSQNILRPIHDLFMNTLKKLKTDGTYAQDDQFERIRKLCTHESSSFDLTRATDRFPLKLQEILVSCILGKKVSKAWSEVLTNRNFRYKDHIVRWNQGQPLGMLSSWAVFALTHHAIIEFLAAHRGIYPFRSYSVLGDDVVIWESGVAERYQEFLKSVGVQINWNKTLISDGNVRRIEFAKRIIFNEHEVTGLKPNIIKEASKSLFMYFDLIKVAQHRNWNLSWSEILAPSFYSVKAKKLLGILVFAESGEAPLFKGSDHYPEDNSGLLDYVKRVRIVQIQRKLDSLSQYIASQKDPVYWFEREGISVSEHLIVPTDGNPSHFHPIVWAVANTSLALGLALGKIRDAPPDSPIIPIEYLPVPTARSYFEKRQSLISKYRSSAVLTAWFLLFPAKP